MMRIRSILAMFPLGAIALMTLMTSPPASAQDSAQARLLAANCANCHGTDGRSQGGMPALAGLQKDYFIQQMQDFKSGKRVATIMHQLSRGYTDAEIETLAGYFAARKN